MNFFAKRPLVLAGSLLLMAFAQSACNNKTAQTNSGSSNSNSSVAQSGKIAYINLDSLQEKYTFWKTQAAALETEQASAESELQRSAQQLQNDFNNFQQKAQSGGFASESEVKSAQQRLSQMQQTLENRRLTLTEQFQKKQIDFNEKLQKNLDEYLEIYNKDKKYDFILSYARSGNILYANKGLDITDDVLKGLNTYQSSGDTTKK